MKCLSNYYTIEAKVSIKWYRRLDMYNNISPEHQSYIVGFLQGDGSHYEQSRNRGKIQVEISKTDENILDKIEIDLRNIVYIGRRERKRDTNFKDNYTSSVLSIYNLDLRQQIKQFIPVGKKASIIRPPVEMEGFDKYSYIRGLTDADGSLGITSLTRPFWSLCTSSEYVKKFIINDIKAVLNFEKRLNRNKRDNIYNIVLFDEDAIKYTQLLYKDATIYLERKYRRFLKIQDWKRSIPKRIGRKKAWLSYEDKVIINRSISLKEKSLLLDRTLSSIKTRLWRLEQE